MPKLKTRDKTVLKTISLIGFSAGGMPGMVDVKDGRIVRVRPFHYDWKYNRDEVRTWKIVRNGKALETSWKTAPAPFSLAYKKRTYSPNRIRYPLKRVDWDPNGPRNPQNRGKSKFKRISWGEATTLIANEIRRIHREYGPYSILMQGDGHGECNILHTPHGHSGNLLNRLGGFTVQVRNADSWEGWYFGTKHVWGQGLVGTYPGDNCLKDISDHADMVLFWGCDPETTSWGFTGQTASRIAYFWKEAGIKSIYICPDLNYGAAIHADKWIPVYPNTDAALQLAIIYMWIVEGTYDKEYVNTHVVGFEKLRAYVLGEEDGIPKTPEWASHKCGVPEWTIKALAREFARQTTSIAHLFGGGYIRGPYSHEPARLEACLLGMQGLGGPGVHQIQLTWTGMPRAVGRKLGIASDPEVMERVGIPVISGLTAWQEQFLPKTLIHKAIDSDEPTNFYGTTGLTALVQDQFSKYSYPISKRQGGAEIHMVWSDSPCRTTCWQAGNKTEMALRSAKIECIVTQHPWLENDTLFSDIILPTNTYMEVEDIVPNFISGVEIPTLMLAEKAIEPVGESKSNFEAVVEVAKHFGLEKDMTEGLSNEDAIRAMFEFLIKDTPHATVSFEQFRKKKYILYDFAEDWENDSPGFRAFYENPEKNRLPTPSGKLEFFSERLARQFPHDDERGPYPKWIEKGITHDERRTSDRAKMLPLLLMSNHGRWRVHAQCDDISWTREIQTCKVMGFDGYKYEPLWINPIDAERRVIRSGDIVKVSNELGIVLGGAYVTERIRPGVVYMDHGARVDFIKAGEIDRGGAINTISPDKIISQNCPGMATSGYLVQVERVSMEEYDGWRREYPEAFDKSYDHSSGLQFEAWIEREAQE
ncbi:MAG: molybdopterin-dependent oxidoreductase [Thermodesulfobacteriota bacterium]